MCVCVCVYVCARERVQMCVRERELSVLQSVISGRQAQLPDNCPGETNK